MVHSFSSHAYQAARSLCPCVSPVPESNSSESPSLTMRIVAVSAILSFVSVGGWFVWDRCLREGFDGGSSYSSNGTGSGGSSSSGGGGDSCCRRSERSALDVVMGWVLSTPSSRGSVDSSAQQTPARSVVWDSSERRVGRSPIIDFHVEGSSPPQPSVVANLQEEPSSSYSGPGDGDPLSAPVPVSVSVGPDVAAKR